MFNFISSVFLCKKHNILWQKQSVSQLLKKSVFFTKKKLAKDYATYYNKDKSGAKWFKKL